MSRVLQVPHNANKHTSVNMHGVWCVWHARQAGQPYAARQVLCEVEKEQQEGCSWSDFTPNQVDRCTCTIHMNVCMADHQVQEDKGGTTEGNDGQLAEARDGVQGGKVWEKAGINVSVVYGSMPAEAYRAATSQNGSSVGPTSLISSDHVWGLGGGGKMVLWSSRVCLPLPARLAGADRSPAGLLARCVVGVCAAKLSSALTVCCTCVPASGSCFVCYVCACVVDLLLMPDGACDFGLPSILPVCSLWQSLIW